MKPKSIAIMLLILSLGLTFYLMSWSFVSYDPSMSSSKLKMIYDQRMVSIGSVIALLQIAAVITVFVDGASTPHAKQ